MDKTAFEMTPPGNGGRLALPWFVPEITPPVLTPGVRANYAFSEAVPAVRIRAVVEAQALAMRNHAMWIGAFDVLRVTGGAEESGHPAGAGGCLPSAGGEVAVADSAALGAALLAQLVRTG